MFGCKLTCCHAVTTIVHPTLDTWWFSWSYYIIVTSQGCQQDGGSSMFVQGGQQTRRPRPPLHLPREGVPGRRQESKKSKHQCAWTSVSCDGTGAAANIQLSGRPAGRVQQESNQFIKVCTSMYLLVPPSNTHVQWNTSMYLYVPACTVLYHLVPSCTANSCTSMYSGWYVLVCTFMKSTY